MSYKYWDDLARMDDDYKRERKRLKEAALWFAYKKTPKSKQEPQPAALKAEVQALKDIADFHKPKPIPVDSAVVRVFLRDPINIHQGKEGLAYIPCDRRYIVYTDTKPFNTVLGQIYTALVPSSFVIPDEYSEGNRVCLLVPEQYGNIYVEPYTDAP
jgi:hypothetical protein